jgi:hypothetical protein
MTRSGVRLVLTVSLVGATLLASGCPAREQQILITPGGVQSLTAACNRPCLRGVEEVDAGAAAISPVCPGSCGLAGHLPPEFRQPTQARLFIVTPADNRVRDASKCMTLPGCRESGRAACLAGGLNQQLDGAIAKGLGFDGLQNPDDVELFLAFYQQQDFLEEPEESQPACRRVDLVACAGLAPPLGGGEYDMSCASCQDGPRNPQSRDNGPCPRDNNTSCFLQKCDSWLAQNGYD